MSNPTGVRLRGFVGKRDPAVFPSDDEALGMALFMRVTDALKKGMPAPAVFVFYPGQIDRYSMVPLLRSSRGVRHRYISAMAGGDQVECVALLGALRVHRQGVDGAHMAVSVFVEWPDNRWWSGWQPLDANRALVGDGPTVRTALDGSPRPSGVGGWFAFARRTGVQLRTHRPNTPIH
jgi:hypothetical protein